MPRLRIAIEVFACMALVLGCACLAAQDVASRETQAIADFEALIKAGKFIEATAALEIYAAAHPASWQALYQLGYAEFRLHRIQRSLNMLCKSIVLNPDFAESHKILAYDLNMLGHQDLAMRELERAIAQDPRSAESHYELGRIYYEQGSYLKSIGQLETAKSLAPGYVRVYHNLGLAYSAIADNSKAVENFDAGIRLNARQSKPSSWPLIDYATYLNMRSEFERARDMLLQAIQIDGTWDREFDELSKSYRGLGQTAEAIDAVKHAIALNARKPEYHYVLARMYTQTHRLHEAKEELAEYESQKNQAAK